MARLTGVRSVHERLLTPLGDFPSLIPSLKQQYLLFDSIGFIGLDEITNDAPYGINRESKLEFDWLKEHNIIYNIDYPKHPSDEEGEKEFLQYLADIGMGDDYWKFFLPIIKQSFKDLETFIRTSKKFRRKWSKTLVPLLKTPLPDNNILLPELHKLILDVEKQRKFYGNAQLRRESVLARYISVRTMYYEKIDAVSLIPYYVFSKTPSSRKSHVARIVINKLPIPDETTSWEQIFDFKNDSKNQATLLGLRRWIRKISSENLTEMEIEEELEWLLNEFEYGMRLHKIKSNTDALEVWVKSPLEVLENLVRLKFSKLADPFFALKKRSISLMEAELHAPGREVAYILKAKDQFANE